MEHFYLEINPLPVVLVGMPESVFRNRELYWNVERYVVHSLHARFRLAFERFVFRYRSRVRERIANRSVRYELVVFDMLAHHLLSEQPLREMERFFRKFRRRTYERTYRFVELGDSEFFRYEIRERSFPYGVRSRESYFHGMSLTVKRLLVRVSMQRLADFARYVLSQFVD